MNLIPSSLKLQPMKSSYFFKMFFLYMPFSILLIIFSSIILVGLSEKSIRPEILKTHQALLIQTQISTDSYILEKINATVIEKFQDVFKNELMSKFFNSYQISNGTVFNLHEELVETVTNLNKDEEIVESIDIYRQADGIILSSKYGLMRNDPEGYGNIPMFSITALNKFIQNKGSAWLCPNETLLEEFR